MVFPTHIVAAGGYVFDKHGNILIVKTAHRGWDSTGGQIENGETLEEGVLREILEESGVTATVRCLVGIYSNVGQHLSYNGTTMIPTKVMFDFICDYVGGELKTSNETSEVIWVPRNKALDYVTAPASRLRLKNVLDYDGRIQYCSYISKPEFRLLSSRVV